MLWEGFYHDFSTKKASSASGGFAAWPPPRGDLPLGLARGRCPLDPRGNFAPLRIYPGAAPVIMPYLSAPTQLSPYAQQIQQFTMKNNMKQI